MCGATLPRAVCPVSGGSGSPLSYQAKTRVSSAGAHSHSLILLRCTLKEPSSGAKQRQPANLTTTLHLLLISTSSSWHFRGPTSDLITVGLTWGVLPRLSLGKGMFSAPSSRRSSWMTESEDLGGVWKKMCFKGTCAGAF